MSEEHGAPKTFQLEEATIEELHRAIRAGQTTVRRGRAALSRPSARL